MYSDKRAFLAYKIYIHSTHRLIVTETRLIALKFYEMVLGNTNLHSGLILWLW